MGRDCEGLGRRAGDNEEHDAESQADDAEHGGGWPAPVSDHEAADDCPDAHGRHEDAVSASSAVERPGGQERQRGREVEGEDPYHCHRQQRIAQLMGRPYVAEPLSDLALRSGHYGASVEFRGTHHEEGYQDEPRRTQR